MGILDKQFVVNQLLTDPDSHLFHELYNSIPYDPKRVPFSFPNVDVAACEAMYELIKATVIDKGFLYSKSVRPYVWKDVNTDFGLDPEQPWWGFELETGYSTKEAMSQALTHCWDSYDNVTYDREGEGEYYSEVTFSPANMRDVISLEAPAYLYTKYLSDNDELTYNSGEMMIGTHINISLPCMRNLPLVGHYGNINNIIHDKLQHAVWKMNRSIGPFSPDQCEDFFGRRKLYAGCFLNSDGKGNFWVEGKLFRTTYDERTFKCYIKTCTALTKCLEFFLSDEGENAFYINNLAEMINNPALFPTVGEMGEYRAKCITESGGQSYYNDCDDNHDCVWCCDEEEFQVCV